MTKYILFILVFATNCAFAQYKGNVFIDDNGNGARDAGEPGAMGISVTDGLHVVQTDSDGNYELPGFERMRFITISVPSGYRLGSNHYIKVDSTTTDYTFGIVPQQSDQSDTVVRFIQITDTETPLYGEWISHVKHYAKSHAIDFILHNGDICYEPGMRFHASQVTTGTLGVPVFYALGNHDLVKGAYGEELFEELFGPTHYSFDAGPAHFVITPMFGGDYKPSYRVEDILQWVKNDLALVDKNKPVVFINHDYIQGKQQYTLQADDVSVNLLDHNLKAWLYGHWHNNYVFRDEPSGVLNISTAPPNQGGIDNSAARFMVVTIGKEGVQSIEPRYAFLKDHLALVSPNQHGDVLVADGEMQVNVQVYDSEQKINSVTALLYEGGKRGLDSAVLSPATDWNWSGEIPLPAAWETKHLMVQVEVYYGNGKISMAKQPLGKPVGARLPDNRDQAVSLQLDWLTNIKANIWKVSPLIAEDKVFIATIDDAMRAKCGVHALHQETGELIWSFPTQNSIKNQIHYDAGIILATDVEGIAYALQAETGQLIWSKLLKERPVPAYITGGFVSDGIYYVGSGNYLQALRVSTGEPLWVNDAWIGGEGTGSRMTIANHVLITGANWSALYGHDLHTGELLWQRSDDGLRFRSSSGTFDGQYFYIASGDVLSVLDPLTGETIRRIAGTDYSYNVMAAPVITPTHIIVSTANEGVVAFDKQTLEKAWEFRTKEALIYSAPYSGPRPGSVTATVENTPLYTDGKVVFGASDGYFYVLDAAQGELLTQWRAGAPVFSDVVSVNDGRLFSSDFSGNIYRFVMREN